MESPEIDRLQWDDLVGHRQPREWFRRALGKGRCGGTYLFVGPASIGKRAFALRLAKTLLCSTVAPREMAPCGRCEDCQQVVAQTHPDLIQVAKPADKATIPLELLIGDREARSREGFCHAIRLRAFRGRSKVALLDDADALNQEGANCLLKILEEPPAEAMIILIGTSLQRQLPTIRSRCQVVRFFPPPPEEAAELLRRRGVAEVDPQQLARAIEWADGDLGRAAELLEPETGEFRDQLSRLLGAAVPDAVAISRAVTAYVEQAGSEAPRRRGRLRQGLRIAVEHYRATLHRAASGGGWGDDLLYRLDRSLTALQQVDRNANQATLIETWADDLQRGTEWIA